MQACLSASKDGESRFHYYGSHVKLVQACLWAGSTLQRHFNRRGGSVKHVQACLSAIKEGESSFLYCGSPVSWCKPVYGRKTPCMRNLNRQGGAVKHVQACLSASIDEEGSFHHWRSCEGRANLLMCGKHHTTPF